VYKLCSNRIVYIFSLYRLANASVVSDLHCPKKSLG